MIGHEVRAAALRSVSVVGGRTRRLALGASLALLLAAPSAAGAATSPEIRDYRDSRVHEALGLQYELGSDVPFRDAPWVGTHNSFNSVAEMGPTLSAQDSNQKLRLRDQLRIDVRSLELDLHWFLSVEGGGFAPVVCHATEQHAGCTAEKPLTPVLEDIGDWLRRPANDDQVLLLYLEDHLDNEEGYDTAAGIVRDELGGLIYDPPASGCAQLPLGLTREDVRAADDQVVIVGNCGIGSEWPGVTFDWSSSHEEERPRDYADFPDCGPNFTRSDYESTLIRYFEDSTQLTGTAGDPDDGITPPTAAAMARCGVDLLGLDQLEPDDGRLKKLVWSWAPDQPKSGRGACAIQRLSDKRPFGRWYARECDESRPVACRRGDRWLVPAKEVAQEEAAALCERRDAEHAVPRTGFEAQLLRLAMEKDGVHKAWLGYGRADGRWVAQDERA